jgi:hypothetical protein
MMLIRIVNTIIGLYCVDTYNVWTYPNKIA